MRELIEIIVAPKNEKNDWRSFVHCLNSRGEKWEIRGYGTTPTEATRSAIERFNEPEEDWSGYPCDWIRSII